MIRKTLGWCDQHGNPQEEEILVTYQDLIEHAGISRVMIRETIDEAIAGKFIRCIREGQPKSAGKSAVTALYQLRWDGGAEYLKKPKDFKGFFEGEGNRTDIPNQFFDDLIPNETLSVIKVVGSIIRFSIGFQARRGRRRQTAILSLREIQNYAKITDPTTLVAAVKTSLEQGFIIHVERGYFDPNAGKTSRAASYSLRWADMVAYNPIGTKTLAGETTIDRYEKPSGIGTKTLAADRYENPSDIQTKQINETFKQHREPLASPVVAAEAFEKLRRIGFDEKSAATLAAKAPQSTIENQINWLDQRGPIRNRLGLLRRAIEENWPEPETKVGLTQLSQNPGAVFAAHFYAGFAGNRGEPTAEPSGRDADAANRFVERLLTIQNDPNQIAKWGRGFGELSRSKFGGTDPAIVSLVVCLRSNGDQFFNRMKGATVKAVAEARQAAKENHEQTFASQWVEYLRATETEFRANRSNDYAKFETERAARRQRIHSSRWSTVVEKSLRFHDGEEQRLKDFQIFFPEAIFDFWRWDWELNPNRLQPTVHP
jgi:hypothetical protein